MGNKLEKFGLMSWYKDTFTGAERAAIEAKYDFSGAFFGSAAGFLADLSAWFNTKAQFDICSKIVAKAEELFQPCDIIEMHFYFMHMINFFYKNRDHDGHMAKAVEYCKMQIAIAPQSRAMFLMDEPRMPLPSHTGYEQLAIIEKKNKNWQAVVDLCTQAKSQGWGGDWDKRIEEAQKKL